MISRFINPLWNLADELSILEIASLIAGYDPAEIILHFNDTGFLQNYPNYYPAETAIRNAVNSEKLNATIKKRIDNVWDQMAEAYVDYETEEIDLKRTTVIVEDLRQWLKTRNFTGGFFMQETHKCPGYLNPDNPYYAPKLAAAINAWHATTSDYENIRGKTPKQALTIWLRKNGDAYGLTKDDGNPNEQGIEEVAKIANWDSKGGAPKTPGG